MTKKNIRHQHAKIKPWKVELKVLKQSFNPFEIVLYRDVYLVQMQDARTCAGFVIFQNNQYHNTSKERFKPLEI